MKICCWNVNGIRAVAKKGFDSWVESENPDIICLQETKAFENQLPKELDFLHQNYDSVWHAGTRPGYSGVATFFKPKAISTASNFEKIEHFHEEGRVVETKFKNFSLLNLYFPNGGTNSAGEEKLSYKLEFYDKFLDYINKLTQAGENVVACGDFNVCHTEIDIARPKENKNSIGFLPEERAKIDEITKAGYLDVFRYLNPNKTDEYTWWSYRAGARPRNVGWRIDYFMISPGLKDSIKNFKHQNEIMGSDHCPLSLEMEF